MHDAVTCRSSSPPERGRGVLPAAVALVVASVCSLVVIVTASTAAAANIAGMAIFLDPGHGGAYDSSMTRQVPNGRGGTKACATSGTATNDGYPEHSFDWDVAVRIRDALNQLGARTQLSRDNDTAPAPCIDQRAAAANAMKPNAIVSIHADGGPPSGHGFHVNYSSPPLNDAQAGPAVQLAITMRDSLETSGLEPSTYIGSNGLYGRADLAGLNLGQYPAVLIELGNMKNGNEAAQMERADGRARYASAVTQGIVNYLSSTAPAGWRPTATSQGALRNASLTVSGQCRSPTHDAAELPDPDGRVTRDCHG